MKKRFLNKRTILILGVFLLLILSGCQRNTDSSGQVLTEKIIYLTTSWGSIWNSDGLFTFLFVYPLAQCINFLDQYVGIVLAITFTTIILNAVLLGLSVKSTVASQKMQMLTPEMNKIQEKYKDRTDEAGKMAQANEMQQLYKKYEINPLTALVVPFLQLPIMIAMYYAVQRSEAVVSATVLGVKLTTTPMQGLKMGGAGIVLFLIFILMGASQFCSSSINKWLSKKKQKEDHKVKQYDKPADPNSSMNIMIYGMLVMIMVLAINWPTAMSLYWLVSSLITIIKTLYIQRRYIDNAKA